VLSCLGRTHETKGKDLFEGHSQKEEREERLRAFNSKYPAAGRKQCAEGGETDSNGSRGYTHWDGAERGQEIRANP